MSDEEFDKKVEEIENNIKVIINIAKVNFFILSPPQNYIIFLYNYINLSFKYIYIIINHIFFSILPLFFSIILSFYSILDKIIDRVNF